MLVTKSGMAESRERAQALILAGKVRVGGETVRTPSRVVSDDAAIAVDSEPGYASRGALKLGPALERFGVEPAGRVCADIGASTGGFTDVLLRRGAARVYAVDVGRGLLHWRIRQDPRVVVMERQNARELESFPEPVSLVVVDVSFTGFNDIGDANDGPFAVDNNTLQFVDKLTWLKGRHTIGMGAEYARQHFNEVGNQFSRGIFSFQANRTTNPANNTAAVALYNVC